MKARLTFIQAGEWLEWAGSLDEKYYGEKFYLYVLMKMSFDDGGVWIELPDGPPASRRYLH